MSVQGLEVVDHTVQLLHEWINDLKERLDWSSSRDVLRLLRVTLTGIRDHISHEEAAQFAAQLPLLVRGMFYEGWVPARTPLADRSAEAFLVRIEDEVRNVAEYHGRHDVIEVFRLLNARMSPGEIADVRASLPEPIRDLWPELLG